MAKPEADTAGPDAERIAEARHQEVATEFAKVQLACPRSDMSDFRSGVMDRISEAEIPVRAILEPLPPE